MKVAFFSNFLMLLLVLISNLQPAMAGDAASLSSEEALMARVKTIWQAKKDDDWETVYLMSDQKFRASVTKNKFLQGKNMVIQDYSVSKVEIDPADQNAGASMVIFKTIKSGVALTLSVKDLWLCEDGLWNIKLSDPANPFGRK